MTYLEKGKLYSNEDESIIYRVLAFVEESTLVYVVNCYTKKTSYVKVDDLHKFDNISEQHMLWKVGLNLHAFDTLSPIQKKLARDRYCMISPLLVGLEKPYLRALKLEEQANTYNISKRRLESLLNTFCAYGRIESLIKNDKKVQYSLKPTLKEVKFKGDSMPGYALLTKHKIHGGHILYLLIDTYSRYIYSFSITDTDWDYGAIKSLIIRCNELNGFIPYRINTSIETETWCSFYRNLECLGVRIEFSNHKKLDFSYLNQFFKCIETNHLLRNQEKRNGFLEKIVMTYNKRTRTINNTPRELFLDSRPIFKDSFIQIKTKELVNVLTNPYKKSYLFIKD